MIEICLTLPFSFSVWYKGGITFQMDSVVIWYAKPTNEMDAKWET